MKEIQMGKSPTFKISLLFFWFYHSHFVTPSTNNKTLVQTTKYWHYGNFCFPYFMHPCPIPKYPTPPPQPPPPATLLPPPTPPLTPSVTSVDQRLTLIYPIIQNFKSTITSDPFGVTLTWVGPDICSYRGFFCDHPPDNITATTLASIDFNGYQLSAPSLNNFLDKLPDLALFHANTNKFSGTITQNIANLKYLYELDISNNRFSGEFPAAVLGMENLDFLDIRFNMFSGSVPSAIFTQNLVVFFLNDNNFISSFPDNLKSTHILYLTLANNKFVGPIPNDIFLALSSLTEVLLLNNRLTGCLPYELGFLIQVTIFDVSNNELTGQLPYSLGCLENVEILNFGGNLLYGMVPEVICGLPNLANLSLVDNYFMQVGPICMNLIFSGVLDIKNNCIPGMPFQRSIMECGKFFSVPRICPHVENFRVFPCKVSHFP